MGLGGALSRQTVVSQWPKIVDKVIAKRAKAQRLLEDTLYVVVDSSVWMNELAAIKYTLLEKINATLEPGVPKIKDIKFSQSSWNRMKREDAKNSAAGEIKSGPIDEKALKRSRRGIENIRDQEIRDILERIIVKDARRKASSGKISTE